MDKKERNDHYFINEWNKAAKNQFLTFGQEEISIYKIKGIILKATENLPKHLKPKRQEIIGNCFFHVVEKVQETFNRREIKEGKNHNPKGYIRTAVHRYIQQMSNTLNVVQLGPKHNYKIRTRSCVNVGHCEAIFSLSCQKEDPDPVLRLIPEKDKPVLVEKARVLMLTHLKPDERYVLQRRYYSYGKTPTKKKVGDELGVTREWARKLEQSALNKLRTALKKEGLLS